MDITLPKWGMSMQEGVITEWHVQVGDTVTEGQPVATVETEKVDAEVEAPGAGTVTEILVTAGDTAPVGAVIARLTP
ncbi:biotin/lipoyl-containing protein [Streptosporangium sp. NPDC051022]|uniref:biotin/lipoyl-containing protein n=1 Tax=Streptosporangium sp. NPDC051022 TaxID=3155752 RepID=UPI00341B1FE3